MIMSKKIKIKQIKSAISCNYLQKRTLKALGLRKIRQEKVFADSPAIRGMIDKVKHLLTVTEITEGT
jgi:large subunit ribosomal protein L30